MQLRSLPLYQNVTQDCLLLSLFAKCDVPDVTTVSDIDYNGISLSRGPWVHENYLVISGVSLYQGKKNKDNIKSWYQQYHLANKRVICSVSDLFMRLHCIYIVALSFVIRTCHYMLQ